MKTTSIAAAVIFSVFMMQAPVANAGQSCWGLQGQALQDCIDKLVDDLSKASNPGSQAANQTIKVKKATPTRARTR